MWWLEKWCRRTLEPSTDPSCYGNEAMVTLEQSSYSGWSPASLTCDVFLFWDLISSHLSSLSPTTYCFHFLQEGWKDCLVEELLLCSRKRRFSFFRVTMFLESLFGRSVWFKSWCSGTWKAAILTFLKILLNYFTFNRRLVWFDHFLGEKKIALTSISAPSAAAVSSLTSVICI